jgi:hypothetical protein
MLLTHQVIDEKIVVLSQFAAMPIPAGITAVSLTELAEKSPMMFAEKMAAKGASKLALLHRSWPR